MQPTRKWRYTVSRWLCTGGGGRHYYVSLFPDCQLRDMVDVASGINHQQKFNTYAEAGKFVTRVRGLLKSKGITMRLVAKDLAR